MDETKLNGEKEIDSEGEIPVVFWAAVVIIGLLAIPQSRFHNPLKILEWTVILFGVYGSYVLPYVKDALTTAAFCSTCIAHTFIVWICYSLVQMDGYLAIGAALIAELVIFSIPGAWIIEHSRAKSKQRL